jgi:CO/xanthine dehydrogenase FAD-binding subunit
MLAVERCADAAGAQARRDALGASGTFVAGGTALQLGWERAAPDLTLVDVSALPAAQGVTRHGDRLRIGAACRLESLRHDPAVRAGAPLLVSACGHIAAMGVRHLATLGGNVGWRYGDALAPLLALDAGAELADGRVVPLWDVFAQDPLPLVVALWIDTRTARERAVFEKAGHRAAFSPSRLTLAIVGGVRLAAVGAGLAARRLHAVERALVHGGLADACLADLGDPVRARLARRLIEGHLA